MLVRKRSFILAALVAVLVFAVPGVAMAFDTVHGGYTMDTDACAGCHRAHTASSPITWTDGGGDTRSALLISTAESNDEFCYTCHGSAALGADTNVWDGIFESDDGDFSNDEVYNSAGEALNGGGFNPMMFPTQHYPGGATWVAWGAGPDGRDGIISMGGEKVEISCSACHDTHGSSNYRLLKDYVAGIDPASGANMSIQVGGYDGLGDPTPWVISAEQGYPATGWEQGGDRMTQYTTYYPDFTTPRYAKAPGGDVTKGISGWCAACHTQMNTAGDSGVIFDTDGVWDGDFLAEVYDANDGFGLTMRHRHPTNVAMSTFDGASPLIYDYPVGSGTRLVPLGNDGFADSLTNESTDWVDCLSCHVAHGSGKVMEGYASVADSTDPQPNTGTKVVTIDGSIVVTVGSVPPDYGNALLRLDNRGTCQACHYK
ncbi:MAG: hypothetical protein JXP37_05750 [Coriobacteriia bacterium]|nr:hypothetical protein [Coriobacteriia bacterium]